MYLKKIYKNENELSQQHLMMIRDKNLEQKKIVVELGLDMK